MSLNSLSARKLQHSAHNSPRNAAAIAAAVIPVDDEENVSAPISSSDTQIAAVSTEDAEAVANAIRDADGSVVSDGSGGAELTPQGAKSPSYQEKLDARLINPTRYRPQSRQQIQVRPYTPTQDHRSRSTHHIRVDHPVDHDEPPDSGQVSFLSSMSLRIKSLEAANRSLRMAVIEKEKQCFSLQREVDASRRDEHVASLREELNEMRADNERLENENSVLRQEVREFHTFLQDYGLQWCGGSSERDDKEDDAVPSAPENELPPFQVDFDALFIALDKLNRIALEDGEKKVAVVGKHATFTLEKPVNLTFYSDGFVVGDDATAKDAFRNYNTRAARSFLQDVLDGFFPWEFNESHPEGVRFTWKDHRQRQCPFASKGYSLLRTGPSAPLADQREKNAESEPTGVEDESPVLPKHGESKNDGKLPPKSLAHMADPMFRVQSEDSVNFPQSPMSAVQNALDHMPKEDARVAAIRSQIANELLGRKTRGGQSKSRSRVQAGDLVVVTTALVQHLGTEGAETVPEKDIATLQVRSLDGKQTLVLKMWASDTIADVHSALTHHLISANGSAEGFDLHCQYPRRVLTIGKDGSSSLKEVGLCPRAKLRMVRDAAAVAALQQALEASSKEENPNADSQSEQQPARASPKPNYTAGHTIVASNSSGQPLAPSPQRTTAGTLTDAQGLVAGQNDSAIATSTDTSE